MVHSIFTNGLNISFGDYLVFVGTEYGNGVPFGIHIESYLYDRLAAETFIGEVVEWNGFRKLLSFVSSNVHIHILLMHEFHCRLEPQSGTGPDLNGWAARLSDMAVHITKGPGLGLSLETDRSWPDQSEGASELEQQLLSLSHALKTPDLPLDISLVKSFIGRGQGLTPSGDDFLVGVMAVEHLLGLADSGVSRAVRLLLQDLTVLTTQVSVNYYYSACSGDFSTVILDLLASLLELPDFDFEECVEALLNVGSTSGIDTYFGLWFAILSYKNVIGF